MNHPKIIAVDFDGCLVTNRFPDIGEPIPETIAALKREQENGAKVILWTCRVGERQEAAEEWCAQQGIRLDAVNDNLQEMKEFFGNDTRKVFANEYWDDRARLMPPSPSTRITALTLVDAERDRQEAKWGEQNHAPQFWTDILGEEYGEYCQAVNETVFDNGATARLKGGTVNMIKELSHVAAVAVGAIERLLRQEGER